MKDNNGKGFFHLLSIIIPAYNEEETIGAILDRVAEVSLNRQLEKEIIVIDDHSRDQTEEVVRRYQAAHPTLSLILLSHDRNQGKGAAIHSGIRQATGEYILIQDADLEYDPLEYNLLIQPVLDGHADVVYGSRFMGGNAHRILFFWHTIGNRMLTFLSNMLTNLNLTDMETGYKLIRSDILKSLPLREQRFGFEPEVTARLSRIPGIRIYEIGISYYGRTYEEGKKIRWKDGLRAIWCILKYNLRNP